MAYNFRKDIEKFHRLRVWRKRWKKVVTIMASIVVFCTTYALILPAITWEWSEFSLGATPSNADRAEVSIASDSNVDRASPSDASEMEVATLSNATLAASSNAAIATSSNAEIPYWFDPEIASELIGEEGYFCGQMGHEHEESCYDDAGILECPFEEHEHTLICSSDPLADLETADIWEVTFADVLRTGDAGADALAIARTQLGYEESERNYLVGSDGESIRGYTRYGDWYGDPYGDWCAMFVSFCLHYAGADEFPLHGSCQNWITSLQERGDGWYRSSEDYIPWTGDLAFIDWDEDGDADHVGLVEEAIIGDDGTVLEIHTIEGNSADSVRTVTYGVEDESITGYGIVNQDKLIHTLMANGSDYEVALTYTGDAEIPEKAYLAVREILPETDEYQTCYDDTNAALLEQSRESIRSARFFDITIMDGEQEIEPKSAVQVEIKLKSTEFAESVKEENPVRITHADETGIEIIPDVQVEQEETGNVKTSFEANAFSVYAVSTVSDVSTVCVGETVTMTGSGENANYHCWSSSDTDHISLTDSGTYIQEITGLAATNGETITVIHAYGKNKNNVTEELFELVVTESESGETTLENTKNSSYTVKVTGNKNILPDGVGLVVGAVESSYENDGYYNAMIGDINAAGELDNELKTGSDNAKTDFDFLQMFHIWLRDADGKEYTPSGENINLKVTITYETIPDGWDEATAKGVYVGHYKKVDGGIAGKEISDDTITDDTAATYIKKIQVKNSSITFHIQSFSVITVATPVTATESEGTSSSTSTSYHYTPVTKTAPLNNWQVVSGNYFTSNATSGTLTEDAYTYSYSDDYSVRFKKQVEATGNENEFKIHLTVEPRIVDFTEILAGADLYAVHNNSADLGGGVNTSSGVSPLLTQTKYDALSDQTDFVAVIIRFKFNGEIFEEIRYINTSLIAKVNNGNVGLWSVDAGTDKNGNGDIDKGEPIALAKKGTVSWNQVSDRYTNTVDLTAVDLATYLTVTRTVTYPGKVIDPMSKYVSYTDTAAYSKGSVEEPSNNNNQTLTWILPSDEFKSEDIVSVTFDDTTYRYYKNAYTLSYTIKLTNYDSCGLDESGNALYEANVVPTNGDTELTYRVDTVKEGKTNGTTTGSSKAIYFSVPTVRGLKYELKLLKQDEYGVALSGATFGLYTDENCTMEVVDTNGKAITSISDENGHLDFANLEFDIYFVKELSPPTGYDAVTTIFGPYVLCYTTNRDLLTGQGENEEALCNKTTSPIVNIQSKLEIKLIKIGDGSNPKVLQGAVFDLYAADSVGNMSDTALFTGLTSNADGVFSPDDLKLAYGTYYLVETKAPDGYYVLTSPVKINVNNLGVVMEQGGAQSTASYDSAAGAYTVTVTNSSGYVLPETGGSGTILYTMGGLLLMLSAGLLLLYKPIIRRKEDY